jgi:selenide,water dikinase
MPRRLLLITGVGPPDWATTTFLLSGMGSPIQFGTGIVNTAIKAGMASAELTAEVTRLMATLNRDAAGMMSKYNISACTDITGFGLLGHLAEMVCGSGMSARIFSDRVPLIADALKFAAMGFIPAGAYHNRDFRQSMIDFAETVSRSRQDVLVDPQTSGGLLISISAPQAEAFVLALKDAGIKDAARIGRILSSPEEKIWVL